MHPKERPVPVLDPLGQPVPQCASAPATRYNAMGLNVYFDKFQKKNKFQRFDSVSLHLNGEGFFEKFFPAPLCTLGGTLTTLSRSDRGAEPPRRQPPNQQGGWMGLRVLNNALDPCGLATNILPIDQHRATDHRPTDRPTATRPCQTTFTTSRTLTPSVRLLRNHLPQAKPTASTSSSSD